MSPSSWALQQALFAALTASPTVQDVLGARIFDAVPSSAPFPYLVLGEGEEEDRGGGLTRHRLRLQLWSRGAGLGEVKQIAVAVAECLSPAALVMDGHRVVSRTLTTASYTRRNDGQTVRAQLVFTVLTEAL